MPKAVSIDRYERSKIASNVRKKFYKIVQAKDPDKTFLKDFTKRVYLHSLEHFKDFSPEAIARIPYINKDMFEYKIQNSSLKSINGEDLYIKYISETPPYAGNILSETDNLQPFNYEDVKLPSYFATAASKGLMPISFVDYTVMDNAYSLVIAQEFVDEINAHNEKMLAAVGPLQSQLRLLLDTIESCKSTKMFEKALPDMVSLYPASVVRKYQEKNNITEDDLSEEEKMIQEATASLAAATLLGD